MSDFINTFKQWDSTYGKIAIWVWRILFAAIVYFATSYLDTHYVSKPNFDEALRTITKERQTVASEQKTGLSEISTKLDALLLRDSANSQRFSDYDRRLDKVEGKIDRLNERLYSPQAAH